MPQQVEIPNIGILEFPDGMSQPDMAAAIKKNYPQIHQEQAAEEPKQPMGWGDVATGAAVNAVPSVFNLAKGVASAVASPIQTTKNVVSLASGGILNSLPEGAVNFINETVADPEQSAKDMALASALGGVYKEKYGTMEGFKTAMATDPAGVLADVATVLTGGGAAASKLGNISKIRGLEKLGGLASKAGMAVDPFNLAGKAINPIFTGAANKMRAIEQKVAAKAATDAASETASARSAAGTAAQDAYKQLEHLRELDSMGLLSKEDKIIAANLSKELAKKAAEKLAPAVTRKNTTSTAYKEAIETETARAAQIVKEKLSGKEVRSQTMARIKRYGPAAVGGMIGNLLFPGLGGAVGGAATGLVLRPTLLSMRRLATNPAVQHNLLAPIARGESLSKALSPFSPYLTPTFQSSRLEELSNILDDSQSSNFTNIESLQNDQ